ncbi:hypothetical protein Q7P37_003344 [Cladosporium fusiforme]
MESSTSTAAREARSLTTATRTPVAHPASAGAATSHPRLTSRDDSAVRSRTSTPSLFGEGGAPPSPPRLTARPLRPGERAPQLSAAADSEPRARYYESGPLSQPTHAHAPTIRSQHASIQQAGSSCAGGSVIATTTAAPTPTPPPRPARRTPLVALITHGPSLLREKSRAMPSRPAATLLDLQAQHERSPTFRPPPSQKLPAVCGPPAASRDSAGYTLPEIRERRAGMVARFPVPGNAVERARRFDGMEGWVDVPGGRNGVVREQGGSPLLPVPVAVRAPMHAVAPIAAPTRPSPRQRTRASLPPPASTPALFPPHGVQTAQARAALARIQEEDWSSSSSSSSSVTSSASDETAQCESALLKLRALSTSAPPPPSPPRETSHASESAVGPILMPAAPRMQIAGFESDKIEGGSEGEDSSSGPSRYEDWDRFDFDLNPPCLPTQSESEEEREAEAEAETVREEEPARAEESLRELRARLRRENAVVVVVAAAAPVASAVPAPAAVGVSSDADSGMEGLTLESW